MHIGRPIHEFVVKEGERESFRKRAHRPKSAQAPASRAEIIIACEGREQQ